MCHEPRRNSPSVTPGKPRSAWILTAWPMQSSSTRRKVSAEIQSRSCSARAASSDGGRSRLPTWSARNGGLTIAASPGCHCERSEAISCRRCSADGDCFVAPLLAMTSWLQRRGAEQLPAVALAGFADLMLGHHREAAPRLVLLLEQPARLGRGVEKQHPPGLRAGALPGMRRAA